MPVRLPSLEELARAARKLGLDLSADELAAYRDQMQPSVVAYGRLDELEQPAPQVRYPRSPGYRPAPADNPLGAWYWKGSIRGAPTGRLAGKRIAIKDNVAVAGFPMMNGSAAIEGYVPEFDATVVTRILDAGGEIVGKAVCEDMCMSGSSWTSHSGPVRNPHDPTRTTGGSSSGSAALVAAGEVDLAIGGDQAGSIRVPASYYGIYGLKPTYGLVPYTGIYPMEMTIDHVGPMGASVMDVALLLEAIAGEDGLDPRQRDVRVETYTRALSRSVRGLRIGVLEEGFAWPGRTEPDVDDAVRAAADKLAFVGADVRPVSVPLHRDGRAIQGAIVREGGLLTTVLGHGLGTNWQGLYPVSMVTAYGRGILSHVNDLADTVKLGILWGQYVHDAYQGQYYAKAQNLARTLTAAYDEAFRDVDLLLMPTTPMKATPLPAPDAPLEERLDRSYEMLGNTAPFNFSGHPAMNVPCAVSMGCPWV
ncbi:MAG: amidase [Dehalococcoidia bacterium]